MPAEKRTIRKKEYQDANVYEAALARINYCYDRFDKIVVNFSGGKDSTAVLNLTIEVARQRNRLPVTAIFYDEEAIHPPTIEYVARVAERTAEVKLEWYCLPVKHRNACSNKQPYWYCWNPEEEAKWVRPLPAAAITTHPRFTKGMSWQEFNDYMFPPSTGSVCMLTGVRTQESFRRFKAVSGKKNDNYITAKPSHKTTFTAHPIYDWSSEDVWIAVHKLGWDYNRTYDIFNKTKWFNKYLAQRVCPPFGEEPLRGLWMYAECFPDLWHKMLYRVPGVATAWRYSNTELYGIGNLDKPGNIKWKEYLEYVLDTYDGDTRTTVINNLNAIIDRHYQKTNDEIPEEKYLSTLHGKETPVHPLTGTSWEFLCKLAIKGDLKGRTGPTLEQKAITAQKSLGINSYAEAQRVFGIK